MAALALFQDPSFRRWLDGVEPIWTLLEEKSFAALRHPPSPMAGPIRLAADFSPEEIGKSAVARNALILLHSASVGSGLKLTATGNLSRGVVAEMCDLFTWPGFDKAEAFRFHKVVNEPDFLPLFFVRHFVEAARLVRRHKDHLKITPTGRQMLEAPGRQALQALLFHIALWGIDLSYLGRGVHQGWPQRDVGILLWSLSVAANDCSRAIASPACARSRSKACWRPSGTRGLAPWKRKYCGRCAGLVCLNTGEKTFLEADLRLHTSIARPRYSTDFCLSISDLKPRVRRVTEPRENCTRVKRPAGCAIDDNPLSRRMRKPS